MTKLFLRPNFALLILAVTGGFIIYFAFGEKSNSAQERPQRTPKATFAQFSKADVITGDIRDRSKELVSIDIRSIDDRNKLGQIGRVVQDFGNRVLVITDKSRNGSRTDLAIEKIDRRIGLPGAKFDPIEEPTFETVAPSAGARPTRGYYVVQFGGTATDEWLDSLKDTGVEIIQYVPNQAFLVYGEGTAISKAASHSRVRWVGGYTADQKMSEHARGFAANSEKEAALFDVAVFARADMAEVARTVGGRLISFSRLSNNFFNVIRTELPVSDLTRIASIPDVFRIDPYVRPSLEDERAAQIVAGNYVNATTLNAPGYNPLAQFGVDGTGVSVAVSDDGISIPGNGGLYITSANTVNGPLRGAPAGAAGGHGHLNASIIAGAAPFGGLDDLGYNYGLGVAPKANIINIPFLVDGNTTTDAQAIDDALNTLGPNGIRGSISNNSWGAGLNGNTYDSLAAQYDGFVRDGSLAPAVDPFSIIFSAGNSGPGSLSLTRPKVSKNTIVVANSENVRPGVLAFPVPSPVPNPVGTTADNMEDLRNSSSRGFTADGRVKPDITAPGTVITGGRAGTCQSVSGCFDGVHAYSIGTSHAAPQVAGAAALFTQYWRNSHAGESPSPSLIKAAIINSAQDMNGNATTAPRPNGAEGWGRISMKHMMSGTPTQYVNESHVFESPGALVGFLGKVSDPSKPVRISLVWTDPPAASDPALVNNLDLLVNVGGTIYRGNVFSNGSSTTGGSADSINNVENVFLPAGTAQGTSVSISIIATALNGDGVLGNGDPTDQHFSLVAYNIEPMAAPASHPPVDFDGDGKTDVSIFRGSVGEWWYYRSSNGQTYAAQFGTATDELVPADYTGDGKADLAFWRPSTGEILILRSDDISYYGTTFGISPDVFVPGDYDADGTIDIAVFRPPTGQWFIQQSSGGYDGVVFGMQGDVPVPADYDGDGRTDVAIYRPSLGQWWINRSTAGLVAFQFGESTDKVVPGDYTGDGKADVAFFRPSTGYWYVLRSDNGSFYGVPFGGSGDLPVPGDYDGDGKFDTGVFRFGTWFVQRSSAGFFAQNFGIGTDRPIPNVYVR